MDTSEEKKTRRKQSKPVGEEAYQIVQSRARQDEKDIT